ncbi:MAG: MYXO-CTERM sorting domain-containing protein [Myxococcales bacterium]|nr:MYXO-CTERM sorting domain-containing protein [Myxococcales bacterium]
MKSRFIIASALAAFFLVPSVTASAGNGTHPRTPVDWSGAPCMTIIDRSQSPIYQLSYAIPLEDTDVTADEVADSRRHQFFAYCRDRHLEDILPAWITQADLDAAVAKNLGNPDDLDLETDILENNPDWAGCWSRITGDDERRPITFAAAAQPVPWDTMALPAGAYVVDGYTWEPWFNLWSPHPGVFKIVDDPTPAANGPAAALTFAEQAVYVGDQASITGCVDAMAGSTMSLSWAISGLGAAPAWQEFAADIPVEGSSFDLAYVPTVEAASNSVLIKVEISDPMGRSWTAHGRSYIAVVDNVGDTACDEGGNFVSTPCDTDTTGGDTAADTLDTTTNGDDVQDASEGPQSDDSDGGANGCACRSTDDGPAGLAALMLLGLLGLGRRRRDRRR